MFRRKSQRRCYLRWLAGAEHLNQILRGSDIYEKLFQRLKIRNNFNKLRVKCAQKKRQEFIERKEKWFELQRQSLLKRDVWQSWLLFVKNFKLAKKFLGRAQNGMDRNQKFNALATWKQAMANKTLEMYNANIGELKRRQHEHEKSIKKVENDILIAQNVKQHTINQMKSLGKKVMANFITRATHMQVAKGFYTWVDATGSFNKKRRLLKQTLVYWMKQNEARAFRKWANTNFKIAEAKLRIELKQKEDQRKNIQRQAKQEAEQQASERQNMTKALQAAA